MFKGTIAKARKVAEYENYTSTDENQLGRGCRKIVSRIFDSHSESEESGRNERGSNKDTQGTISQGLSSRFLLTNETEDTVNFTSSLVLNDASKTREGDYEF